MTDYWVTIFLADCTEGDRSVKDYSNTLQEFLSDLDVPFQTKPCTYTCLCDKDLKEKKKNQTVASVEHTSNLRYWTEKKTLVFFPSYPYT